MKRIRTTLLLALAVSFLLSSCSQDGSPTPSIEPTSQATATQAEPIATATVKATATPSNTPIVNTSVLDNRLVYISNGNLVVGGAFGESAEAIASLFSFDAADIQNSRVAIVHNKTVQLYDLASGDITTIILPIEGDILASNIAWSQDASSAICAVTSLSEGSETSEQLATLFLLEPDENSPTATFPTTENLLEIIGYDGSTISCLASGRGLLPRVITIDLAAGMYLQDPVVETEGALAASNDLAYLLTSELTTDANIVTAYDMLTGSPLDIVDLELEPDLEIASIAWSPDASQFAYILRERRQNTNQDVVGLGLWIYDLGTQTNRQILDEDGAESRVVTWDPEGDYVLVEHVGLDGTYYYYAIRTDGSDRRFIVVPDDTTVLGWATGLNDITIQIQSNNWESQFLQTAGDIDETVQVVARFVAESGETDDIVLSEQLADYLTAANWEQGISATSIILLDDGVAAAHLPNSWIGILDEGNATRVANSDLIIDARLQNDRIGLIYGTIGASAVQPSFVLLHKDAGEWITEWTPQGQRDWITTDGSIAFVGEGIDTIQVTGTTFGITIEPDIFDECHVCAHRDLASLWLRSADGYERDTDLSEDASFAEAVLEMTAPSSYATVYNVFSRIAQGQSIEGLVANSGITQTIEALELGDEGKRLIPEITPDDIVQVYDPDSNDTYAVQVENGIITAIEKQ